MRSGTGAGLANAHFVCDLSDGVHLRGALELFHPREAGETHDNPYRRLIQGDECGFFASD